jgi:hypothetical protein
MKKQLTNLFAIAFCALLISSCATLTGFEEGRALGEENSELIISANFTQVPDLFDDNFTTDTLELDTFDSSITFPNLEFSYKRGVSDKLDVGGRISTNLNASAFVKYQLVGDNSSPFALGVGGEFGTVLGIAYSASVPVFATYYPAEAIAINISPRISYQFGNGNIDGGVTYLGGNFGLLFGKKNKFGLDFGYYNVDFGNGSDQLVTFGLGGKFKFGDFSASSSSGRGERGGGRSSGRGRR